MISSRWLQKRRPYWARVDELTARSEKGGIRALSHNELRELAVLYRQTASDLATIREDPSSNRLAQSLNQLLGRAHNSIYMGRRAKASGIVAFYRDTFPQVFHDTLPYTLAACAVFFATAAAGFVMAILDPGFQRYFLGGAMMESIDKHQMWTHSVVSDQAPGVERDHDQQPDRVLRDVRARHHRRCRHRVDAGLQRIAVRRRQRGVLAGGNVRPATEFCRAARSSRIARYLHCRGRRIIDRQRPAISRNAASA